MRWLGAEIRHADEGFTLFEALLALVLMGLILGALGSVTAQWLPSWDRGLVRAQRSEQIAVALDRMVADLSAAQYVSIPRANGLTFFSGSETSLMFVRSVLGPNNRKGWEVVRIAETSDSLGTALVRTRVPYVNLPRDVSSTNQFPFGDPVVLFRAPLRIAFEYADPNGNWSSNWRTSDFLPTSVRFNVRDTQRGTVISTSARIHAQMNPPYPDPATVANAENAGAKTDNGQQ